MNWAGAAAGANDALQDMLVQRRAAYLQHEQLKLQQAAQAQQAAQLAALERERAEDRTHRDRVFQSDEAERTRIAGRQAQQDAVATSARNNAQGTKTMIGDFLTRRQPGQPLSDTERGSLEAMSVTDDVNLPASLMAKPQRKVITTLGKRGEPVQRAVTEEELIEGVPEYRAPQSGGGTPDQQWVIRDGKPTPIPKGTARPGDLPYDAVAARQQNGTTDPNAEAVDTAREAGRIALKLRDHPGFNGAFGVLDSKLPTVRQATADAEVLRESLMSLLTLENMGKMKGVLSDRDMQVLRQASTTLSGQMSEAGARAELDRLANVMAKVTGGGSQQETPSPGTVQVKAPDGQIYTFPNATAAKAFRQAAGF